jgi:multidrug transporter EmrE-like cation transporter
MTLPPYLLLAIAIVAEVIATTALKQSAGFTRMPTCASKTAPFPDSRTGP